MSSSTAVDAARAASSSASAAIASCSSSEARADRTRRGFGRRRCPTLRWTPRRHSVAARIASIRSALRIRVAALTPIAPAMVWSSSRSLPVSMDRSMSCSGLIGSLSRPSSRHAETRPRPTDFLSAFDGRKSPPRERTWNGRLRRSNGARNTGTGLGTRGGVSRHGAPENQPAAVRTLVPDLPCSNNPAVQQQSGRERLSGDPPQPTRRAMRWCATTGALPATARSVYSPPGPGRRESKKRYGTGADVWVRNAHGVA